MKKFTAILLALTLSLLWVYGGAGNYLPGCQYVAEHNTAEGINRPVQHAITVLREATSIFEAPVQVRIPAPEQTQQTPRFSPAIAQFAPAETPDNGRNYVIPGEISSRIFPKASRSVDHYIYGLRKIVI